MSNIKKTRIAFIVAGQDEICPKKNAKELYDQIESSWKTWHQLPGQAKHDFFGKASSASG